MYNWIKNEKINGYIDLFGEVVNNYDYTKDLCDEQKISNENYDALTKEKLLYNLRYIKNIEEFKVALFVERSVYRKLMYDRSQSDYSFVFKMVNFIFFHALLLNPKDTETDTLKQEKEIMQILFSLTYCYFSTICNEATAEFAEENVNDFFNKAKEISFLTGDMHSYQITQKELVCFLQEKGLSEKSLLKEGISLLSEQGYMDRENAVLRAALKIASKCNQADPKDDILVLDSLSYLGLSKKFQQFIENFEARKSINPTDSGNELIFAYKTKNTIYISKFCMNVTQEMIEKFSAWEQYENLIQYYYNFKRVEALLSKYNKWMTYKIADLVFKNGYILPFEQQKVKGEKMQIPQIEIKNYIDKKKSKALGDIDVLFYSPYTNILYVLEYKNYQMYVTGNQNISSDISKLEREDTVLKVCRRMAYVVQHKEKILSGILHIQIENCEVLSIILTTKPNFYFFVNRHENDGILSMEWVEFRKKAERHQL